MRKAVQVHMLVSCPWLCSAQFTWSRGHGLCQPQPPDLSCLSSRKAGDETWGRGTGRDSHPGEAGHCLKTSSPVRWELQHIFFFFRSLLCQSGWLELSHFHNIFIARLPFCLFPYLNSNLSPNPYFSTFTHITAFNFKYCSDIFGRCFLFLSPMEAVYSHMPLTHSFPSRPLPGIRWHKLSEGQVR